MTAYVKNYHSTEEREAYQHNLNYFENIGWRRDVPEPFKARPDDNNPASLERERLEKEEDDKDAQELRMFGLFAEAVEDLYTGSVERYVRKTPALWEEFVMKLENGDWYLVDPDPTAGTPTVPTEHNLCLDIHNNLRFSPRLCLWAVDRKLEETYEKPAPGTFAEFALNELRQYVERRSEFDDDFYKHLVINTQTHTFEDVNYVNSIGSKNQRLSSDLLLKHLKSLPRRTYSCSELLYFWILPQHHKMQWTLETHHQVRYQNPKRKL